MTFSSILPRSGPDSPWWRDLLFLCLIFGALYASLLGVRPLVNPDEGRYAEIPREMVASGDWVTPRLNGVNYFEKPPLMYWTVAGCLKVFGTSEWALRAPSALFALGGVLLTYAGGRRMHGRKAGLAAAVVLGTSLLYYALAQMLILDMAVSVLMSATLFCFLLGVREPPGSRRRWLLYGLYASAALATLTKGLIGFLITGAVMFLWLLVFNQWKRLRPLHLPSGGLLFLALAAPWHLLMAARNPTWAHRYFVYEHWERFLTPAAGHTGGWWYFIPVVLLGLFPWMGFLWPALRDSFRGGWAARAENAGQWFLITWAVFIFLFFSASESKLPPYILPVFSPLAVLIGKWLAHVTPEDSSRLRGGILGFSLVCGLLAAALLAMALKTELIVHDSAQAAALRLRPHMFVLAAVLLMGAGLAPRFVKTRRPYAALSVMAAALVLFLGGLAIAMPDVQKPGTKELAVFIKARAQPGDRVMHYHEFFHDFTFYAGRVVDVVDCKGELELEEDAAARASGRFIDEAEFRRLWTQPGRIFAVARKRDVQKLFADPDFSYHLLGETRGHYLFSNRP